MQTGTVKSFNAGKGFGYIVDDASKEEIFFHISGLEEETVRESDRVSFEVEMGRKGKNAVSVRLLR
ncbi:MAG: cold shock domain-containing protein [Saprospiraceae bacterium]|nr:cold shock domain-containing protein [Saprospiraceae bacterium]